MINCSNYMYNIIVLIVLTEHIVEVREKQNSDGFDRYPFEEAEEQSFSLLVEGEIQGKFYIQRLLSSYLICLVNFQLGQLATHILF